jgi:hypothetical protein
MKIKKWSLLPIFILILIALSACAKQALPDQLPFPTITEPSFTQPVFTPSKESYDFGLTYQNANGNRLVEGQGRILDAVPINIELGGEIQWLVGLPYGNGSLWTAALVDGTIESYTVQDGKVQPFDIGRGSLPAGMPPMIIAREGDIYLNTPPSPETSDLTHPVSPDPASGRLVFITIKGDLVLWEQGTEIDRLDVNALPDARLIMDEKERLIFLSYPTNRYDHGVLGDSLEAASITLVETDPVLKIINRIEIPNPAVIEGIAPIWADLNGDGEREILVTISDYDSGARLVLYSEEGLVLAEGPPAGQVYRWRHQLAVAPLGPDGQKLIIDVLRPHLDATLEFFSWEGDRLVLKGELPGYSSHGIGSRNLDMALVGDLDGNGDLEVVAPGLGQEILHGIAILDGTAEILWTVPLGGRLTSNLVGVTLGDGSLLLGAGVGETILIWE